ncbi:MAG: 2OG-Fe(II) oxygenase [Deltaproteobacteria bacterium]|nr:2OG-Fe(II) oxygenase [Deltaproteobacteria bacterium]MBW2396126.1 2OG-Fe(II) oxygenase [Deltaproteobacteria bacterium]
MNTGSFLDFEGLEATPANVFRSQRPYPWWAGPALRPEAWRALHEHLPDVHQLEAKFGKERRFGQASHDRYVLEYGQDLPVHPIWHQLVEELEGPAYQRFLAGRLGRRRVRMLYHWHYTPRGCSVSPHCDARRKRGSHIFYFNDPTRWQPEWGGETCILDDEGRFSHRSSPSFEDFAHTETAPCVGNQSLLFARRANSWHGVRPLTCPEGELRRAFIVVFDARWPWQS